jgi:hypothetical protein
MRTELNGLIKQIFALDAQTVTNSAVNGTGFNKTGYESAVVTFFMGSVAGTSNQTITFSVQESTDDGNTDSYAAVNYVDTSTVITATATSKSVGLDLNQCKKYLRVSATPKITGGQYVIGGAIAILGSPKTLPTNNT